jgi:hypothetical protein
MWMNLRRSYARRFARVSTQYQNPDLQLDVLTEAGSGCGEGIGCLK